MSLCKNGCQFTIRTLLRVTAAICLFLGVFRRLLFHPDFLLGVHDGWLPILWLFGFEFKMCQRGGDNFLELIGFIFGILLMVVSFLAMILVLSFLLVPTIQKDKENKR